MKKRIIILLLIALILSCFSLSVYAVDGEGEEETEEEVVEVVFPEKVLIKYKEEEKEEEVKKENNEEETEEEEEVKLILTFYDAETEEELFTIEDEEYQLFLTTTFASVEEDAKKGLDELSKSEVTVGHIKLEKWGKFLAKYYNKNERDFPLGDIDFIYEDTKFVFKNTKEAKELVLDVLIPEMIDRIVALSMNYPAKLYVLNSKAGCLLEDYVCDTNNVIEKDVFYPLKKNDTYQFYNVGANMCMGIDADYVNILRGYIENFGDYRRVETSDGIPGCVSVLSYIVLVRDVSNYTLSDNVLADFMSYNNMAIRLDTKELVDMGSGIVSSEVLRYEDYKLKPENLVVVTLLDSIVVVQTEYLECFEYNGVQSNFADYIDITNMLIDGVDYFTLKKSGQQVPIKYFADEQGNLDVRLGNSPFLIYYNARYMPYGKLVNFVFNQKSIYFARYQDGEERAEKFLNSIRDDLTKQGRTEDFDSYMTAAGQKTDKQVKMTKIIIVGAIFLVVIIVGLLLFLRYKKVNSPTENPNNSNGNDVLFNDDDDDDDDDDSFELK